VYVTSRFPKDAARRYSEALLYSFCTHRPHTHRPHTHTQPVLTQQWVSSQEKDFGAWKDRLHILMADFRDIRAVEVRLASSFVRFSP
jgi:hypothetical protein